MRQEIETLIREVIQPLLQADGGQIELVEIEGNTVVLRLSGTCSGCPGRPYTTAGLIEPLLRRSLGGSLSVRYVDS